MLHGINRERKLQGPVESRGGVRRVIVRYVDGRTVNVVPDSGRKAFSEDDLRELKKILNTAASTVEWADISSQQTM